MATKIGIHWDEVYPVYFVEDADISVSRDFQVIVEETELADILAIQENFWELQRKLQEMCGHDED